MDQIVDQTKGNEYWISSGHQMLPKQGGKAIFSFQEEPTKSSRKSIDGVRRVSEINVGWNM